MTKDAYYFSHDSNAKDDPKCVLLIEQLGLEGYGIFWILIETLRDQPGYKYPIALIPALARRYNTTSEKMKAVVQGYSLFELDEKDFFSLSLINRMERLDLKREQARQAGKRSAQKRLAIKTDVQQTFNDRSTDVQQAFNGCSTNVQQTFNDRSTSKVKESKVKESIVNENIVNEKIYDEMIFQYTNDENLKKAIKNYIKHRENIKKPIQDTTTLELILEELNKHKDKVAVLNQSIMNGWQGIFELKNTNNNNNKQVAKKLPNMDNYNPYE
jgi:hypothetical protein